MYYIASNYHLYFIVDIDEKSNIAKVYSMPLEKPKTSSPELSFAEFDPSWHTYSKEDQDILQDKFIPSQLLQSVFHFSQCWISHTTDSWIQKVFGKSSSPVPDYLCDRILLKQSQGNYISISKGCVSFYMEKYERVQDFISYMGMNESVFPYVITNKQIYCLDYVPYTVDKKYSQDPYNPNIPIHEVTHQILIDPPDVTDIWWDNQDSK